MDYDPDLIKWKERFRDRAGKAEKPGHTQMDYALADAAWYLEDHFAKGNAGSNLDSLYAWEPDGQSLDERSTVILSHSDDCPPTTGCSAMQG